jgi:DNA-binding NtrC family response regulator
MPPLRERAEDLPGLVEHLMARFYDEEPAAVRVAAVSPAVLTAFTGYPWPGNVRELRNVLFHSLVRKRAGDELLLSDLPVHVIRGRPDDAPPLDVRDDRGGDVREPDVAGGVVDRAALARSIAGGAMDLTAAIDALERAAVELALDRAGGSPTRAARLLGRVGRGGSRDPGGTVRAMMRRLGIAAAATPAAGRGRTRPSAGRARSPGRGRRRG